MFSSIILASLELSHPPPLAPPAATGGGECPQRIPSPSKCRTLCPGVEGTGLKGVRYTQCPGSQINSQLPTHPATHGTKECDWLGSCMGHPSPQSRNYPSSLCLSAPRAGEHLCPGPYLGHQAHAGLSGRASPIFQPLLPPTLPQRLSLYQPLTLLKLAYHIIADNHNKPKDYYNLICSRHWVKCFSCIFSYMPLNNPRRQVILLSPLYRRGN